VLMKIQVFCDATVCQLESVKYVPMYHSVWHNILEDLNHCVSKCRIGQLYYYYYYYYYYSEVDMYATNFTPQYENLMYAVCMCFPPLVMHVL
jgi:hypothetical protein